MPTVSGSGNQEVESQDEVKVFKYEGEEEESEKCSSESLLKEDKSSLITETEEEKTSHVPSSSYASASKSDGRLPPDTPPFGIFGASAWGADRLGYLSPFAYAYTNGSTAMAAKEMGLGAAAPGGSLFSLYHNGQTHLGQPPPAHMGIAPYQLDPKAGYEGRLPVFPDYSVSVAGLRPPMYPFPTSGQYPYPLTADFTAQMASAWFSPSGLMHPHPGLTPPLTHPIVSSPKTEIPNTSHDNSRHHSLSDQKSSLNSSDKSSMIETKNGEKKPHIKKPLNAFMLYMKEMRAKVVAECTLKESAAINQILGRKWHALSREEQAKYYEMARKERQLHMQMYPGWSSRQNYSQGKKKKRNRDKNQDGANMKKCRARYGLEQQSQWCKPCSPGASLTAGALPASLLTAMGTSSGGQVSAGAGLALTSGSVAASAMASAVTAMAGAHLVSPHPHLTSVASCYSPAPTTPLHSIVNLSMNNNTSTGGSSSSSSSNNNSNTNHENSSSTTSHSNTTSSSSSRDNSSTSSSSSSSRHSSIPTTAPNSSGVSSPTEPTYVNL